MPADQAATSYAVDLAALATAVGQRLHNADMRVTPHQSEQFARALQLARPSSRRELYYTARATFVTDVDEIATFDRVFAGVFGTFVEPEDKAAQAEPVHAAAHA
jgi:uncharacterized protein with von Willebrand factor type A (vWA) domain